MKKKKVEKKEIGSFGPYRFFTKDKSSRIYIYDSIYHVEFDRYFMSVDDAIEHLKLILDEDSGIFEAEEYKKKGSQAP